MHDEDRQRRAIEVWKRAYAHQRQGELDQAIQLYLESLAIHPTGEAHTFLGWTYSFQGRLDEAIAECHKAIAVDPDFGNPYNDIGVYLMQKGDLDGAIPWLESDAYLWHPQPHVSRLREQVLQARADGLQGTVAIHWRDREMRCNLQAFARFARDLRVQEDLEHHVPKLVFEPARVAAIDGLDDLVSLFDGVSLQRVMRLLPVPWAALFRPQPRNGLHQRRKFITYQV